MWSKRVQVRPPSKLISLPLKPTVTAVSRVWGSQAMLVRVPVAVLVWGHDRPVSKVRAAVLAIPDLGGAPPIAKPSRRSRNDNEKMPNGAPGIGVVAAVHVRPASGDGQAAEPQRAP
ncbi:hypothetical protein [Spirillospora sp. NPDC047279]|uniref:hypothetical protein n=1 Tax=Spirillospora sp. NPDC047279 TaxID=3155478 RepID=UPI0034084A50